LIAPLVIKKTAKKARDHQALVRMLADSIPIPHERSAFVRDASSALGLSPKPEIPQEASSETGKADLENVRVTFSKDALASVAALLMAHIGPVAKILVSKASKTTNTPEDLLTNLARSIDNERARSEFLASAKKALGLP